MLSEIGSFLKINDISPNIIFRILNYTVSTIRLSVEKTKLTRKCIRLMTFKERRPYMYTVLHVYLPNRRDVYATINVSYVAIFKYRIQLKREQANE